MAFKREQVVRSAEKYVARGKLDAAIKEYHKVLQDNPSDTSTLNRLGDLYARQSRTPDAVRLFTQTAEHYAADGFLVKSIAIYKKIIRLDPRQIEINGKLAELYARQGLVNDARSHYQSLVDHHLRQSQRAAAIGVLQKMAELEPENPSHQLRLAELFLEEGLHDRAVLAYRSIAELMLEHDRVEEAVRVFRRAFEVRAEDLGFLAEALGMLRRGRHVEAADQLLQAAVELNPEAGSLAVVADAAAPAPGGPGGAPGAAGEAAAETSAGESGTEGDWAESGSFEPPDLPGVDDEVFVLEVDDDVSTSLVAPPADMTEPGEAFRPPAADAPVEGVTLEPPSLPSSPGEEETPSPALDDSDFELELELEDEPVAAPPTAAAPVAEPPPPSVPAPAPEPEPEEEPEPPRLQDLVAEAEVFAKYGLEEKARERAEQILARSPGHLEGLRLLLDLRLRAGDTQAAGRAAARLRAAAVDQGRPDAWDAVRSRLEAAGVVVAPEPGAAEHGPPPTPAAPSTAEAPPVDTARGGQPRRRPALKVEDALAQLTSEILERPARRRAPADAPASQPPAAAAAPAAGQPLPAPAPPPTPTPPPPREAPDWADLDDELPDVVFPEERTADDRSIDDTDMGWLDEAPAPAAAPMEEKLFEDEDDFFDLAAELEQELEKEDVGLADEELAARRAARAEPRGDRRRLQARRGRESRRRGLRHPLQPRHRLPRDGPARRGDRRVPGRRQGPGYLIDCCSMLGLCFLEKGLPELAVKWYRRGLEQEGLAEDTTLSLLYELGDAYVAAGDETAARSTFVELYGRSSGYRDVSARVAELGG
jgi:pilus assembly protein FimV